MQLSRLIPTAAIAGLAVGLGVAMFPGDPQADTRTGPNFHPSAWELVFDFATVGGESAPQTVTVTNDGPGAETFAPLELVGTNRKDFKITADGCSGTTLTTGQHCDVAVAFSPTAPGTRVASVKFADNTPCADFIHLSGSGREPAPPPTATAHAASCEGPESQTVTTTTPGKTTTQTTTVTTTTPGKTTTVPAKTTTPSVNSPQSKTAIKLPPRCRSHRKFRIHLRPPAGKTFGEIVVRINGRRFSVVRGKQITSRINLTGLPRGRFTLKIRASLLPNGAYARVRHYVTCVPKKS